MVWERWHRCVTRSQDFLLGATASAQGAALSSGSHMRYTYAQRGLANSHTVFCTPQRPREGGR